MRLKALEINGFKSFADKTTIEFLDGITAVIGPNGSGKSNVSDAIRWVLGEMSTKTLRGSKMEDVIFSGTDKRGQLGFAEVSLTIDNTQGTLPVEYNEVTVTRRYYRSGESEYFINRSACRLKDVHEMFMDTGLGRDGYSIIGQGRIDEILSLKGDERRQIFEEAAGISKYRYRKEESERKLTGAEENLVRIGDIVAELEDRIEPLFEQSEKAKKYLEFANELKVLEISVFIDNIEKSKDSLNKLRSDIDAANSTLSGSKEELNDLYNEIDKIADDTRTLEIEAEQMRTALAFYRETAQSEDSASKLCETNMENITDNLSQLMLEGEKSGQKASELKAQLETKQKLIVSEKEKEKTIAQKMDELSEKLKLVSESGQDKKEHLDVSRAKAALISSKIGENNVALSAIRSKQESMLIIMEDIAAQIEKTEEIFKNLSDEIKEKQLEMSENDEKLNSARNVINGYAKKLDIKKQQLENDSRRLSQMDIQLKNATDRKRMLVNMEQHFEGFSGAVKDIMTQSQRGVLKNIHGPLSKLITADKKYAIAIETALGGAMQNIVVDSENDAKKAISHLKATGVGRATFLPLTAVRPSFLDVKGVSDEDGFVGIASDLVSYDKTYDAIVKNLLGRTVVFEDLDKAVVIAKKYGFKFKIVTLDGQIIFSGGAMTGGSVQTTGVLTRSSEIENLTAEIDGITLKYTDAEKALAELKTEVAKMDYTISVASDELRLAQDKSIALNLERDHLKSQIEASAERKNELLALKETNRLEIDEQKKEIERIALENEKNALEVITYEQEIYSLTHGQDNLEKERGSLSEEVVRLQLERASCTKEQEALQNAVSELLSRITELSATEGEREIRINELRERVTKLNEEKALHDKQRDEFNIKSSQIQEDMKTQIQAKLKLESRRVSIDKRVKEINEFIINQEKDLGRLESRAAVLENEESQFVDYLWQQYEITYSDAVSLKVPIDNIGHAKSRINKLKSEIRSLGTINVAAIEEYDQVKTRYDFLTTQRDDLIKSKEELNNIITEMTSEMKRIFKIKFTEINENFNRVFVEIFGGGQAHLELEDPQDILNCGIEIKVMLPGKSLKVISLLSGGEKAFVAIALYFAILKVRPAPFCVLDEIDAALDDVNGRRFANYLKTLSKNTQFIMITHRKENMEISDMLYGVTMQEKGVSKVLALNIKDIERDYKLS